MSKIAIFVLLAILCVNGLAWLVFRIIRRDVEQ
jgi:hypothetical protein